MGLRKLSGLDRLLSEQLEQDSVEVITAVVEAELGLLEVQVERMTRHALELREPVLGEGPEALDAVDVRPAVGELVLAVVDAQVPGVADVDQAVVAGPAVGVDDGLEAHLAPDRLAQRGFLHVGDDLGVDLAGALEHAEDDRLAPGAAAAFALDPAWAEVRLVDLDFPPEGALGFAVRGDASAELEVDVVDRTNRQAGQLGGVGGGQVHREGPDQAPENLLADSGTPVVAVFRCFHRASVSLLAA